MKRSIKPLANPICVLREEFDDYALLFNPETAAVAGLNPVGVAIWKLLDGKRDLPEITRTIQAEFENVPETAPDEVQKFIDSLVEQAFAGYELETA